MSDSVLSALEKQNSSRRRCTSHRESNRWTPSRILTRIQVESKSVRHGYRLHFKSITALLFTKNFQELRSVWRDVTDQQKVVPSSYVITASWFPRDRTPLLCRYVRDRATDNESRLRPVPPPPPQGAITVSADASSLEAPRLSFSFFFLSLLCVMVRCINALQRRALLMSAQGDCPESLIKKFSEKDGRKMSHEVPKAVHLIEVLLIGRVSSGPTPIFSI